MAAGLGFKDFTTGEVLTAADVDGYLMQGIWVFASAAARDAAVTSPQEGNACYLKDTDVIQVYTGSAWAAQSASNPISANIVDAKGDLIVGTAADTVSRLAVGTNGYTLVADSAQATGLKWAAPAGGGKVLQVVNATYSTLATNTTNTFADTGLTASITPSSATSKVLVIVNQAGCRKNDVDTGNGLKVNLLRGATEIIADFAGDATLTGTAIDNTVGSSSICYLDSPSTTSATTYKTQFKNRVNSASVSVQFASSTSTITLMEIGA